MKHTILKNHKLMKLEVRLFLPLNLSLRSNHNGSTKEIKEVKKNIINRIKRLFMMDEEQTPMREV